MSDPIMDVVAYGQHLELEYLKAQIQRIIEESENTPLDRDALLLSLKNLHHRFVSGELAKEAVRASVASLALWSK